MFDVKPWRACCAKLALQHDHEHRHAARTRGRYTMSCGSTSLKQCLATQAG